MSRLASFLLLLVVAAYTLVTTFAHDNGGDDDADEKPMKWCPSKVTLTTGVYTGQPWLPSACGLGVTLAELTTGTLRTGRVIPKTINGVNPTH